MAHHVLRNTRMRILPARLRPRAPVPPLRPGRFGVVFAAQPPVPARAYDPAAVFGAHRPPAPPHDADDTIVCAPWWLARL